MLAIPMELVSSVFLYTGSEEKTVSYDSQKNNTHILLPVLFNCPSLKTHHGIVLKDSYSGDNAAENKIILLSTEIESEKEIPSDIFYPVPKALGALRFSSIFKGIVFDKQTGSLVLLLNPEQLIQSIKKELIT